MLYFFVDFKVICAYFLNESSISNVLHNLTGLIFF